MKGEIQKYEFIDAVRGFAILLVVMVHSSLAVPPASHVMELLMAGGARGVQLFYIASALTLCMSWHSRKTHEASPIRNFYIRRLFRIAPMFYLAIMFYVWLYGMQPRYWAPNGVRWWFIPLTVLFANGVHPETINSVVPGGWSIAVEMSFYLVLPFVLRVVRNARAAFVLFVISLLLYFVSRMLFQSAFSGMYPENQQYLVSSFTFLNCFGQLPVFAIGIFAYFQFTRKESLRPFVIVGDALLGVTLLVFLFLPLETAVVVFSNHIVLGFVFALFALTLAVFHPRVLVNSVTAYFGKISFSMYLAHFAVIDLFQAAGIAAWMGRGNLSSVAHYVAVAGVTAGVSSLFYLAVERPGIALGRRLIEGLEAARSPRLLPG